MRRLLPHKSAFTIVDDTDHATVTNTKPIYDLLASLGMRTTKTVWPLRCDDPSNSFARSETLEDAHYAAWVRHLQAEGFEIAFHGASSSSNLREKTVRGLDRFSQVLGEMPTMHINHHLNRDNLYWGAERVNSPFVRSIIKTVSKHRKQPFDGHQPNSAYYWGDIAASTIRYCRNLVFVDQVDVTKVNATMPYYDRMRTCVPRWFSACDGGTPLRFQHLLRPQNLESLATQGGICIVYVHFGAGFVVDGKVLPNVEKILRSIAQIPEGIFLPASKLLDALCPSSDLNHAPSLPVGERRRMEWFWLKEKILSGGTS
jgi:hypothetical protein